MPSRSDQIARTVGVVIVVVLVATALALALVAGIGARSL